MRGGHEGSNGVVEVLTLVCGSGFVCVEALSLVSVLYCNALRESVAYLVRMNEATPARLMGVLRPPPSPPNRILLPLRISHLRLVVKVVGFY